MHSCVVQHAGGIAISKNAAMGSKSLPPLPPPTPPETG